MNIEQIITEIEQKKAQLFDVRELSEWQEVHFSHASLVPLSNLTENIAPQGFDKDLKTYLHCHGGIRVLSAQPILAEMGFTNIIPLEESFYNLAQMGLPFTK